MKILSYILGHNDKVTSTPSSYTKETEGNWISKTFLLNFCQKLEQICNISFKPTSVSSIILGVYYHTFKDILNICIVIL